MKIHLTLDLSTTERLALERAQGDGHLLDTQWAQEWAERALRWRIQELEASQRTHRRHARGESAEGPVMETCLEVRLARLTGEWQPLVDLKLDPHEGGNYYDTLRWMGLAEERREPIVRHGIACGERTFYRLSPAAKAKEEARG